ncbi:MAG: hypothetical protein OHK0029_32280 [Armatimonadaceae bacterium]
MATTKQKEQERTLSLLADEYLNDLIYNAFLEWGEAAKISELTEEINNPRIHSGLVRRALGDSPRFITVDRMWDIAARYLDTSRPTERNLIEAIIAAGRPMSSVEMATELSNIYSRDSSDYFQLIKKLTRNELSYFKTTTGDYGLAQWLPLVDAEEEEDVLFDNHLTPDALEPYRAVSLEANWSPERYVDATLHLVSQAGQPISHRLIGVLAWYALGERYDPIKHITACLADTRLLWLSSRNGGRWIPRTLVEQLEAILEEKGRTLSSEEEVAPVVVVAEAPPVSVAAPEATPESVEDAAPQTPDTTEVVSAEPVVEAVVEPETVTPLTVSEEDLQALAQIVSERGAAVETSELLALRFEVVPGDPSYRDDVQTLQERLQADERFLYVGAGRFREPNSLPLFIYEMPGFLGYPDLQFISMDGEIMDEEIAEEGYAGTLRQEVMNPLAQDANDDEGEYTGEVPADADAVRLVVKAHHKDFGTFPLCQVPDGFMPTDSEVVEVTVRDPNGVTHDLIVNNALRLAFNLFGLYEFIEVDSGGAFTLRRGNRPFEYVFEAEAEPDPQVYIAPERMEELQALKENAEESGDVATFDMVCEVLAHYPKGLDFVQLLTEVNIVRRVTRRKLASILSNYLCFMQKPGQNLWRFDAKKRDLGTDREKRKYIKR